MRGHEHVVLRHLTTVVLGAALTVTALPGVAVAASEDVASLPRCAGLDTSSSGDGEISEPWQAVLDTDGAVSGHRLTLRHGGQERRLRAGRRGFSVRVGAHRLLVGERAREGTRLDMIDTARACRLWTRQLSRHLYPERDSVTGPLRLTVHDRDSRRYEGTHVLDPESGATQVTLQEPCVEMCLPHDGGVGIAALEPAGAARPTPNFSAGGWSKDKKLTYRWKTGAVPPSWAAGPLQAAAQDATRSSAARSPRFVYSSRASQQRGLHRLRCPASAAAPPSPAPAAACPPPGACGSAPTARTTPGARCAGARRRHRPAAASTSGV